MPAYVPRVIALMMAQREMRMHHYLWHTVRDTWLFLDKATQDTIRNLGWEPPRSALKPSGPGRTPIYDNASGEDFFFMHRQMIASVNAVAATLNDPRFPRVEGWRQLPLPNDVNYPVPPSWDTGDADLNSYLQETKSDAFFATMHRWKTDYRDATKLKTWSLGELGARVEFTIHNRMHMRWCADPRKIRPDVDPASPGDIDTQWDDPSYDWLGDTYSSHVNPIFWHIHGWVDDTIQAWAAANAISGQIPWRGTWVGKAPAHPMPMSLHALLFTHPETPSEGVFPGHHDHSSEMKEVLQLLIGSGKFHHLYDKILVD